MKLALSAAGGRDLRNPRHGKKPAAHQEAARPGVAPEPESALTRLTRPGIGRALMCPAELATRQEQSRTAAVAPDGATAAVPGTAVNLCFKVTTGNQASLTQGQNGKISWTLTAASS